MKKIFFSLIALFVGLTANALLSDPITFGGQVFKRGGQNVSMFAIQGLGEMWKSDIIEGTSFSFDNQTIDLNSYAVTITGKLEFNLADDMTDVTTRSQVSLVFYSPNLWFYNATVRNSSGAAVNGCTISGSNDNHTYTITIPTNKDFYNIQFTYLPNEPLSSSNTVISGIDDTYIYTGRAIEPVPTVTYKGNTLTEGTDYTFSYSHNNAPGEASVIISGTGNYGGTVSKNYIIRNATLNDFNRLGENTYEIATKADLDNLANYVNTVGDCQGLTFLQTADIAYNYTRPWDRIETENNFTAIGGYEKPFKGNYDGKNHTISGIRISKEETSTADQYQGLFGYLLDGTVENVVITDTRIIGYTNTGGIVGYNAGTIKKCRVGDNVLISLFKTSESHGGIAGGNYGGTISHCTSCATIGGRNIYLFVYFQMSTIDMKSLGGVVGTFSGGTIDNCLAVGAVVNNGNNVGAIIGNYSSGTLTANYYHDCQTIDFREESIGFSTYFSNMLIGVGNVGDMDGARSVHAINLPNFVTASGESVDIDSGTYYAANTTVTLTVTLDEGYELESLTVTTGGTSGAPMRAPLRAKVAVTPGENGTYTFVMPAAPVTVNATFKEPVVTGVTDINAAKPKTGQRYNLMGQPVGNDYKGIVIQDGKKVIVK